MKKSYTRLIKKVASCLLLDVRELEKVERADGKILTDCIQVSDMYKIFYICADSLDDVMVYDRELNLKYNISKDVYKTEIEKAVGLTMALTM